MIERTSTRRGQATRDEVLQAAARAMLRQGFAGTSLADVAGEAGVSKSSVLYHFGTKDQLLRELMTPVMDEMGELVSVSEQTRTPLERRHVLGLISEIFDRHRGAITAVAADTLLWRHEALGGRMIDNHNRLIALLAQGLTSSIAVQRAHMATAAIFRGMAFGLGESGDPVVPGTADHRILLDLATEILEGCGSRAAG